MYSLARSFLFALDAEHAHELALKAIAAGHCTGLSAPLLKKPLPLPTNAFGLRFGNPVGLAAGLDKNGAYIDALAALGFCFVEIGTTTPRPQPGNPKPRLFRLPEHQAIINRLGFNNDGVDALLRNVERARRHCVLGINIGKNKDTPNERAIDDYRYCLERVFAPADYVTVNVSSPNTPGLRDLQSEEALRRLLGTLREEQERLAVKHGKRTPMLVKIAPDLSPAELDGMAATLLAIQVDGVICTNTTLDHAEVAGHRFGNEAGGVSGQPLFRKSTAILHAMAQRLDGRIPLIGVGGITTGEQAAEKISAGAALVQFYTGLIYRGPALITASVEAIRALPASTRASA